MKGMFDDYQHVDRLFVLMCLAVLLALVAVVLSLALLFPGYAREGVVLL